MQVTRLQAIRRIKDYVDIATNDNLAALYSWIEEGETITVFDSKPHKYGEVKSESRPKDRNE